MKNKFSAVYVTCFLQLCDFQAVLCTEDEKKIRHLDTLYEVRLRYSYNKPCYYGHLGTVGSAECLCTQLV